MNFEKGSGRALARYTSPRVKVAEIRMRQRILEGSGNGTSSGENVGKDDSGSEYNFGW